MNVTQAEGPDDLPRMYKRTKHGLRLLYGKWLVSCASSMMIRNDICYLGYDDETPTQPRVSKRAKMVPVVSASLVLGTVKGEESAEVDGESSEGEVFGGSGLLCSPHEADQVPTEGI